MINAHEYRRRRHEGYPAHVAAALARPLSFELEPEYGAPAEFERDGFTLRASLEYDEFGDGIGGSFTDRFEPGAVLTEEWRRIGENYGAAGLSSPRDYVLRVDTYRWYVPAISADDHRAGLAAAGYSRHVADCMAREYVENEYRRAVDSCEYVVTVRAFLEGVELGSASVGGVDPGTDPRDSSRYLSELADELADEAICDARESMSRLCESARRVAA